MRWLIGAAVICTLAASGARAQPSAAALNETVTMGTLATLAPLCVMRDDSWAEDLRRATIAEATGATGVQGKDDTSLHDAPGANVIISVLGDAEHEALEVFTEEPGGKTCADVAHSPDLARADRMVGAFRAGRVVVGAGS
jgi:hypothetical protein